MKDYYEYKYGRYGYSHMYQYSGYSSGSSYTIDVESQTNKLQKRNGS